MLIPIALLFAMGFYIKRKKFAYIILGVMTVGMLFLVVPTIAGEKKRLKTT